MKKSVLIFHFLLCSLMTSFCQEFSKNAIYASLGVGFYVNEKGKNNLNGVGTHWSMGYQRDIWKNRLRIVPSLTFGTYTHKGITTRYHSAFYNSTSLKCNLNFDIIKIKSFSIFIGLGTAINYSNGLTSSAYFNEFLFAYSVQAGLRINSENNRIAYELVAINSRFDKKAFSNKRGGFVEESPQIRIIFKLK